MWIANRKISDKKPDNGVLVWVTDGVLISNGVYYHPAMRFYIQDKRIDWRKVQAWTDDDIPPPLEDAYLVFCCERCEPKVLYPKEPVKRVSRQLLNDI